MRVNISKSKNSESLYIVKSINVNGKNTSKIVERLGTIEEVRVKAKGQDPYKWARARAKKLTQQEKDENRDITISLAPKKRISKNTQRQFNVGYLPLQKIYHELSLDSLAKKLTDKGKLEYDLDAILASLIYSRII